MTTFKSVLNYNNNEEIIKAYNNGTKIWDISSEEFILDLANYVDNTSLYYSVTDGMAVYCSRGLVSKWLDQSSFLRHAVQTEDDKKPLNNNINLVHNTTRYLDIPSVTDNIFNKDNFSISMKIQIFGEGVIFSAENLEIKYEGGVIRVNDAVFNGIDVLAGGYTVLQYRIDGNTERLVVGNNVISRDINGWTNNISMNEVTMGHINCNLGELIVLSDVDNIVHDTLLTYYS